jgi:hypothetical protein
MHMVEVRVVHQLDENAQLHLGVNPLLESKQEKIKSQVTIILLEEENKHIWDDHFAKDLLLHIIF